MYDFPLAFQSNLWACERLAIGKNRNYCACVGLVSLKPMLTVKCHDSIKQHVKTIRFLETINFITVSHPARYPSNPRRSFTLRWLRTVAMSTLRFAVHGRSYIWGNRGGCLGCFHDSYLSGNNYFDQLNFKYESHESRLYRHNLQS